MVLSEKSSPQTAISPTTELVVGILDDSHSSCMLVNLPRSPVTSKIELEKQDICMKLPEETPGPKMSTRPVETTMINSINEEHLSPTSPPPTKPDPLTNIDTLTTNPLQSNEVKFEAPETILLLVNQQVETEKLETTPEQTAKDETAENVGPQIPTTSEEALREKSDKTKSINETGKTYT